MGLQHDTPLALRNKVFITCTKDDGNRPTIFTNYIRAHSIESQDSTTRRSLYDYEMMYDEMLKFKSWEVARATSAAPLYFPSFERDTSSRYWDGGLCHNNPAWIARQEVPRIWAGICNAHPDILLSIGSGYLNESKPKQPEEPKSIWGKFVSWFEELGGFQTLKVLRATLLQNLDSEHAWTDRFSEFEGSRDLAIENRYFRLNPHCRTNLPELDDLSAFKEGMLAKTAESYLGEAGLLIKTIARRLIATSFYFEPDQSPEETENGWLFIGHIACRFFDGSQDLKHFFGVLKKHLIAFRFKIKEADEYLGGGIDSAALTAMEQDIAFRVEGISFTVPKEAETFTILLEADAAGFSPTPISGCPWRVRTSGRTPLD